MRRDSCRSDPTTYSPLQLDDLVVSSPGFLLERLQELRIALLVLLRVLERIDSGVVQLPIGEKLRVATEDDVGAAASHVGGHRDRGLGTRQRDDGCFTLVLLGVEDLVLDSGAFQQTGQDFGFGDRCGADEHRLALLMPLGHILHDGFELGLFGAIIRSR